MMDSSKGAAADTPAEGAAEPPDRGQPPAAAPKPVDTGAQERAGQDRADGGGYT